MPTNKTLVVLHGPTGVGKTELSLKIAEFFCCPILNADSRQIYKGIPVGTAAPSEDDLKRVKHYFVHQLELDEYYSAAQFEADAISLLEGLFQAHDVVLLSGGSMMYIDAVCEGIDDIPTVDDETREMMKQRYLSEGLEPLVEELLLLDPEYCEVCDLKNPKRVVHALEICHMTGKTYTSFRVKNLKQRPFKILKIGLQRERTELFERINKRVDEMVRCGLVDESKSVLPYRHCNSLNTVGYKEMFNYLDGEWGREFAIEKIKRNSRVYAKKQMTWFKKDASTHWFHPSEEQAILDLIKSNCRN